MVVVGIQCRVHGSAAGLRIDVVQQSAEILHGYGVTQSVTSYKL